VVCWRLDRLGRNLKHLITLLEEPQALGVALVSLAEGIDATTPAGRLQMHLLAAIAELSASGFGARGGGSTPGEGPRQASGQASRSRVP